MLKAVTNFEKTFIKQANSSHIISSNFPSKESCLQIIDYFLWALQRLYERHENRYFNYVKEKFTRIIDPDDKRVKANGVYYDLKNELSLQKIKDSLLG